MVSSYPPLVPFKHYVNKLRSWPECKFKEEDMEELYQAEHKSYVLHFSNLLCILQCLFFAAIFTVRAIHYGVPTAPSILAPELIPFVIIGLLAIAVHFIPHLKLQAEKFVVLASFLLLGCMLWNSHNDVSRELVITQTKTLPRVWALLVNSTEAEAQLTAYVITEESRKQLNVLDMQVLVLFNILQFIGLSRWVAAIFISFPFTIWVTAWVSSDLVDNMFEGLLVACAIMVCALFSSYRVLKLQRNNFFSNYSSQRTLAQETRSMQQAAEKEKALKEASVHADSILNHILKNIMADAAGCIYLFLQSSAGPIPSDLSQAMSCLSRGMHWCRRRQALLRITSGQYLPAMVVVNLQEFGNALVRGRQLMCNFVNQEVVLDPILCDIVLDNAINNAFRHGKTASAVGFTMELTPNDELSVDEQQLTFRVTNQADPSKPRITPQFVSQVMAGEYAPAHNELSDHLGLQHLFMAAQAHGMQLSLEQQDDVVVMEASLVVRVNFCRQPNELPDNHIMEPFPPGLTIVCLDDSAVARRLMLHTLKNHISGATVLALGETAAEIDRFLDVAMQAQLLIVDNNLDFGHIQFAGTALLSKLFCRGFGGFACIRSASMSAEDRANYFQSGAHCAIGKDLRPEDMVQQLRKAYIEFTKQQQREMNALSPLRRGLSAWLGNGDSFMDAAEVNTTSTDDGPPDRNSFMSLLPGCLREP